MKRFFCIFLAVVMVFALGACGKSSAPATYNDAGYYEIFSMDDGEDVMSASDFADLDWTVFLQLNEDGTGVLDMDDGDRDEFTWQDGSITYEGQNTPYTLAGSMLTLDLTDSDGTFVMIFKKGTAPAAEETASTGGLAGRFAQNKGDAAPAEDAPIEDDAPAAANDDVVGTYRLAAMTGADEDDNVTAEDLEMMESLGMIVRLYMNEDGTGSLDMYGEVMELEWDASSITVDGEPAGYTYGGGILTISEDGESLVFEKISDEVDASAPAVPDDFEPTEGAPLSGGDFTPVGGDIGDYHVEILGAEYFLDSDGEDAVRFYYDFTNNSDETTSAWWPLYFEAEEDGYKLTYTYASYEDDVPEYGNEDRDVQPGCTIRCIDEYSFRPDGSVLTYTLYRSDEGEVTATFDPQALPGRPGDWTPELIEDPQFYLDYPSEGSCDDAYVAITGAELAEEDSWYGDGQVIRVYFDFTNYDDDEAYIESATTITAFQDGIELKYGYAEERIDSDSAYYDDIPSGESASVSYCWEVRTGSPVEIVVEDWWNDTVICAGTFYLD